MHLGEEPSEVKPLVYNNRSLSADNFSKYHWSGRSRSSLGLPFQMRDQCRARWRMIERDSERRDHARIPDQDSNSGGP